MPSSVHKARKAIAKKRNGHVNALHEKSRDSFRLRKAGSRDERLGRLARSRNKKERPIIDRVAYFQDAVQERGGIQSVSVIQELIHTFIHQYDAEHDELKKERRRGRPATHREDLIKLQIDNLQTEHENGFCIPDITNKENVEKLENWDGTWTQLNTLAWIKVTVEDSIRPAELPTRGLK